MTVQINFEKSEALPDDGLCKLVLENPEKAGGDGLGTYRGYTTGAEVEIVGTRGGTWWEWENPHEPLKNVTFSPSLITHFGGKQMFHVSIQHGEVVHCSNCNCGCQE